MQQPKHIRTGMFTSAALFISAGLGLLADLNGWWDMPRDIWQWWPVLPLLLGVEILLTQLLHGREALVTMDGLSLALVIILVGASIMLQVGGPVVHISGTAEHRITQTETVTDLSNVQKVRLDNPLGTIEVDPSQDGVLHVRAEMIGRGNRESEAKAQAEEMSLQIVTGDLLSVQVLPVNRQNQICNLVVEVPAGLPLEVQNKFGHVDIHDRQADLLVGNGFGSVEVSNITGNLQIDNEMGSITADQITGNLTIYNSHGRVTVSNISGQLDVTNSFATVEVSGVKGTAVVHNQHGLVAADDLQQGGTLSTTFGTITARQVTGNISCRSQNGSIELSNISGDIEAITSFAPIQMDEVSGAIKAINQNGRITLDTSKSLSKPVELRSSFGPLIVQIPETSSLELDAETTFANISGKNLTIGKQGNTTTATGTIGSGGAKALLRTSHGSIEVTLR